MKNTINFSELNIRLTDLFGFKSVSDSIRVHGGHRCQNFSFDTDQGRFFLKQYRERSSDSVHEIKFSEQFFRQKGFPVIMPCPDRFNRLTFWFSGNWFSVFPFIEGNIPKADQISETTLRSLGGTLARMHQAGFGVGGPQFHRTRMWDSLRFNSEIIELEEILLQKKELTKTDHQIIEMIEKKKMLVEKNNRKPTDFPFRNRYLIHGDMIYQNTFVDSKGEISHIFDFEKTARGPRAFELARSMYINAFDDGWEPKNFEQARIFLQAYRSISPFSLQELLNGVEMYLLYTAHMTWMEERLLLLPSESVINIFPSHCRRVSHLLEDDLVEFCQSVYPGTAA
ncbi:phosphotransferase enzyme family protein [Patescibacteria group bacterium]